MAGKLGLAEDRSAATCAPSWPAGTVADVRQFDKQPSARPFPVDVSLRASLNGLGLRSRGARVIDRDLESLASGDSLGPFSGHHGALAAPGLDLGMRAAACETDGWRSRQTLLRR
jgi:hypothetical protein